MISLAGSCIIGGSHTGAKTHDNTYRDVTGICTKMKVKYIAPKIAVLCVAPLSFDYYLETL